MKTYELEVEGMSCQHCVRAIREALDALTGVKRADVQVGHVHVEASDDVTRDALAAAIATAGYRVAA